MGVTLRSVVPELYTERGETGKCYTVKIVILCFTCTGVITASAVPNDFGHVGYGIDVDRTGKK